MRPLTEEETKAFFEKLSKFIGDNVKALLDRADGRYCFRLHKERIYYMSEALMKRSASFGRDHLLTVGTCFGKFTKKKHDFRMGITALEYLAPYCQYKIWLKPSAEQQFLYGHNVMKSGLARITENTPQYRGVVIYNMADIPLGFGISAKSTAECRNADPMTIICFHQSDVGEYLRNEAELI
ncbi:unnamed protein product [Notodromas monacha]|uniref:60S ribosome subunit biogenesis protein NIP7 homolog n=1 Tax=Notodromas monacha TaxID=399045 RepID=A0A7R9BZP3_9CRUS|nr:unnamed protein product [Notodromas monacha]CAD7284572.1 unnamed protein product [Notodromas monacha]CAG0915771.1 unnamed protein product [Notodromas monacha]CAG0924724.1 unnamed protein product [Notodromas monacha]